MGPEQPSFFEWAFACVRSRAFRLGEQRFAFVPFLDIANHSPSPNAGFRWVHARSGFGRICAARVAVQTQPVVHQRETVPEVGYACRQDEHGADVELVALSDVRSGEEATLSYTDRGGYVS